MDDGRESPLNPRRSPAPWSKLALDWLSSGSIPFRQTFCTAGSPRIPLGCSASFPCRRRGHS